MMLNETVDGAAGEERLVSGCCLSLFALPLCRHVSSLLRAGEESDLSKIISFFASFWFWYLVFNCVPLFMTRIRRSETLGPVVALASSGSFGSRYINTGDPSHAG